MKKIILFVFGFFVLGLVVFAEISISEMDRELIVKNLNSFVQSVNKGNIQEIDLLVSSDNTALQNEIKNRISSGIGYQLDYNPLEKKMVSLSENTVRVKGRFSAYGSGWNISGLSNYYIFEKSLDGQWLITDTDFTEKMGFDYLKKILVIVLPIFLIFLILWLWMLIDCIKRNFDDKALWVVLMLVLNIIASILYYFMIKKKNITKKPLEFKM